MEPIPVQIGRYVVESLVGSGGMGRIYKAHDPDIRRTVARTFGTLTSSRDRISRDEEIICLVLGSQTVSSRMPGSSNAAAGDTKPKTAKTGTRPFAPEGMYSTT